MKLRTISILKAIVATVASLALIVSCADRNPLYPAIEQAVIDSNPTLQSFYVTKLDLESQVTLADELNRRQSLFAGKEKAYAKAAEKYKQQNMPNNFAKNENERQEAAAVLERIGEYRANHGAQMDSVIYYVYRMSGYGYSADKAKVTVDNNYVIVSPVREVLSVQPSNGNPYTGMGTAIPGDLTEIIGRAQAEDE